MGIFSAPDNPAVGAAQAAQTAQQQQIKASVDQITQAFNNPTRTGQINDYGAHLQNYYDTQVNNQEGVNARNLNFADARSGLTGGSAAVDANGQLQRDYTQGLLNASNAAVSGKAALQNADTNSMNQMVGLANQGGYTGVLPMQSSEAQNANLQNAQSAMNPNALGNLFQGTANIYNTEQTAAANRLAARNPLGSIYGGNSTGGASPYQ